MMLSGLDNMSFLIELTGRAGADTLLRPRRFEAPWSGTDYARADAMGPAQPWGVREIEACADWWSLVASDQEPADQRHLWFGGGIAFGRVGTTADVAIDIIVLSDPSAERPSITYASGAVHLGRGDDYDYHTVDTTFEEVRKAHLWWQALAEMTRVTV
jgi:hypothetical protein